jgi:hypothetical protein
MSEMNKKVKIAKSLPGALPNDMTLEDAKADRAQQLVRVNIDITQPLTAEHVKMLQMAEKMPIVCDEDCPELTDEQLAKFRRAADDNPVDS